MLTVRAPARHIDVRHLGRRLRAPRTCLNAAVRASHRTRRAEAARPAAAHRPRVRFGEAGKVERGAGARSNGT